MSSATSTQRLRSRVVSSCQVCHSADLAPVLFLGYLPPVNLFRRIGASLQEESAYPTQLLYCRQCSLVQLGLVISAEVLFPRSYPYTSSTTTVLRDNFAELSREVSSLLALERDDLVLDIGSNDGNLLSNFKDRCKVVGVTPEDVGQLAVRRGIPTVQAYFNHAAVERITREFGRPTLITATNVFAHIDNIHEVVETIIDLLEKGGTFISESHYLLPLLEGLQYDTVYHEHLRYYSLRSLRVLLAGHGLEVFHAKEIPTHGGSLRVYAARKGAREVLPTVEAQARKEQAFDLGEQGLREFAAKVASTKLALLALVDRIRRSKARIFGVGAPSRAATLVNYVGLDEQMIDCVVEISGSYKIGSYMPGTLIPVVEESALFEHQPEYAMLLSWHIADELVDKLRKRGFRGKFIVPLPEPRVL